MKRAIIRIRPTDKENKNKIQQLKIEALPKTDIIYNLDVLEGFKRIPDSSIDLIVTSPPYNKGYWAKNRNLKNNEFNTKSRRIEYGEFNDTMEPEEYEKWQREVLNECVRVIKPTGSIFYNHKDILSSLNTVHPTYVYDYAVKQVIVWDRKSTPSIDKRYFLPITEWIYWIKKDRDSKPYFDRKAAEFQKNIWSFPPDRNNDHPAPFPIELPENCILACTKEGDIVLDPFMGSGTTALAAKKHGRHYIGFELNAEYINNEDKNDNEN